MPLLVGLHHEILQDFLLVTLTTVSVLLLLLGEGFQQRRSCVGLGVAMGLGTLTKVTFPIFMVGPLVVVLAEVAYAQLSARRAASPGPDLRAAMGQPRARGAASTRRSSRPGTSPTSNRPSTTSTRPPRGRLSEGAGPRTPADLPRDRLVHAPGASTTTSRGFSASPSSPPLAFNLPALRRLIRPVVRAEPLLRLAFVAAWATIPYLIVATAHNQDVRLMAPAIPAMAVIVAGAVAAVPARGARVAIIGLATVALVYQTASHVVRIDPPLLPDEPSLRIGDYSADLQLDDQPIGYERLPESTSAPQSCATSRRPRRRKTVGRRRETYACFSRK